MLFNSQLYSPSVPTHKNKILWVSKPITRPNSPLVIRARLKGSDRVVTQRVVGGPGPSDMDVPSAGCWSVTLSWSGHQDTVDLKFDGRQ